MTAPMEVPGDGLRDPELPEGAASEAGASETSGNRRPPALPRPGKLGTTRGGDFRDAPREPSVSSSSGTSAVPRGIKPPSGLAAPEPVEAENTDVLIASVADALAAEAEAAAVEGAPVSVPPATDTTTPVASGMPARPTPAAQDGTSAPSIPAATSDDEPFSSRQPAWVPWAAVAGVVAVVLLAFVAWPSDAETDDDGTPAVAAAELAPPKAEPESRAPVHPEPEPEPEPDAVAAAMKADVPDSDEAERADDAFAESLDGEGGGNDAQDDANEAASDLDEAAERDQAEGSSNDSRSRRRSPKASARGSSPTQAEPTPSDPEPQAKSSSSNDESASSLLAQAKSELSRGKSREAYALASASYRKAKSSAALQVMARAACQMGNKANAKYAFDRLGVNDRAGIRAECRKKGIRLGI